METQAIKDLMEIFGIDLGKVGIFVIFGMAVVAWLKNRYKVTGLGIDITVALMMLGLNAKVYWPDWPTMIISSAVCYYFATGGWQLAKDLIKKVKK